MSITLMSRQIDIGYDHTKPPGVGNPGGGIVTKFKYICKAIPNIKMIKSFDDAGSVNIIEMLWFMGSDKEITLFERIDMYRKCPSLKFLLISDPSFCRMADQYREEIFDITDAIIVSSRYTENWIKAYAPHAKVFYIGDPIDLNEFNYQNTDRTLSIVGCSQVSVPKNIESIINIFSGLSDDIEKGYIGGPDVWGGYGDEALNLRLKASANWTLPNAMSKEVAWVYKNTFAYIADTKYDTYCYAMVEAMASGCWLFLGRHPLYDDGRPCFRFETDDEAIELIEENMDLSKGVCEASVQWVRDNYSLEVYRKAMADLIGRKAIYG